MNKKIAIQWTVTLYLDEDTNPVNVTRARFFFEEEIGRACDRIEGRYEACGAEVSTSEEGP